MLGAVKRGGGLLWQTVSEFMSDGCPQLAAALSYYTVFSLPPLLVLLFMIVGAVVDPATVRELLTGQVGSLLGSQGATQVESLIRNASRPELGGLTAVLGIAAFLFGATGAFAQLQLALNRAWGVAPDPTRGDIRNFLTKRFISFTMILAVGFLLLVSLVVSALITAFGSLARDLLPGWASSGLLQGINAGVSFVAVGMLFALMFRYVPDAVVRWRDALVGGAFTSVLFTLGKAGIGYWLGRSDPGSAYGAAGSLAVALLWIYYSASILLLGAEFTEVWAERRGEPIVPEPGAARVIQSQERYVTTPEPKSRHEVRAGAVVVLIAAVFAALVTAPAVGQEATAAEEEESPRVASVTFEGVTVVDEGELRAAIATEERRCKGFLYVPLCWISDSGTFEHKPRLDREELQRDELRIRVHYWRQGYRQATVASATEPANDGVHVVFTVSEGEPTIVTAVEVQQTSPVLDDGAIQRAELPPVGQPLDVMQLDSARLRLRGMLWEAGYADGVVHDTAVVSESGVAVRLEVTLEPDARTTIAQVDVRGNEGVSATTIRRLMGLEPGQVFRRTRLVESQRRLYRSELFRQALIEVPETQDSAKDLVVTVREAPFRSVQAGAGFNTVEFVQAQAQFTRYNWLGTARQLDLSGTIGNLFAPQLYGKSVFGSAVPKGIADDVDAAFLRPTWQLSAEVTQPWLFSTRNALSVRVFSHRRSVPGIVVDRGYGASSTVTRELGRGISTSLTYRFERTTVEAGDLYFCVNFGVCRDAIVEALRGSHKLSPLQLSALVERSDDPLDPTRGWNATLEAEHASGATFSDFRYNRLMAEVRRYIPAGRGVLAMRFRAGWVRGTGGTARAVGVEDAGRTLLHPRKRFYSGGSSTVRGYGENQLGPRILTIDPQRLISPSDSTRGEPCTIESIQTGECDPNLAPSDEFLPRPLGGSSVIGGSIEYRMPLGESLVAAAFVDAASVGDADLNVPPGARRAITPGFGIRYRSPIGPVRVDLGIRPALTEDLPVVTQIAGSDGELRLVQLGTLKQYDPVETSGGFLRSVVNRLQLHLSIGEAF
jgi:membrane protein